MNEAKKMCVHGAADNTLVLLCEEKNTMAFPNRKKNYKIVEI